MNTNNEKLSVKCSACCHWNRLDNIWSNVKNSKFGECSQPKLFYWDSVREMKELDRRVKGGDEVLVVQEYYASLLELENGNIIVGENFGCVHFKPR